MVRLVEDESRPMGNDKVRQFSWHTDSGCSFTVLSFGAVIYSIKVRVHNNQIEKQFVNFFT